jgi:hypothetical protein
MSVVIDALILVVVGVAIYAEIRRGLFLALADVIRLAAGLVFGFAAYSSFHDLFHSYAAGVIALMVAALTVALLVPTLLKLLRADPAWGRTALGRLGAGLIGLGVGFLAVSAFVPAIGRSGRGRDAVPRSYLAQPFLDAAPALYYVADALNLDFAEFDSRAVSFEAEGRGGKGALAERVNFTRLTGATCVACGSRVRFDGYFRVGTSVAPRFTCPKCGRTSDGCQTFEGFHRMYRRCPAVIAESLGPIDCGVWTNGRAVYPRGVCPVCGRSVHPRRGATTSRN